MAELDDEHDTEGIPTGRPRYRQPIGMPMRDEGRRAGAIVSVVVHAVVIFLLIVPFFMPHSVIQRMQQGAGGAGPAGGGGGGNRGTGGQTVEKSQFGSTACKSIWVCNSCRQPFEHFKAI